MSDEKRITELLGRLEAHNGALQAVEALRLAVDALGYISGAATLTAAKTTADGALFGIRKEFAAENFNAAARGPRR